VSQAAEVAPDDPHTRYAAAKANEEQIAAACRRLWLRVRDADEETQAAARELIDRAVEQAEDATDLAAADAAEFEGGERVPWETVKIELGL